MPLLPYLSVWDWGFILFCIVFRVQNAIFTCVSLRSFVSFLVSSPLYVKADNLLYSVVNLHFAHVG
jgi:hypothetical protein